MCTFNQVWLFATPWTVTPPGSSAHGILQARVLEWVASHSLLQGISLTKWSKPHFLHLLHWQADSLPLAPPGKPYNHPVLSHSVMSDSVTLWTVACQAPLSMGILQARILEWVAMPSSKGSSQPKDQTRSPTFQAGSLLSEPPGKPTNTAVGSLYLLQGIFLTQELNQGLLHCRRILYSWVTREAHNVKL